MSMTALSLFRDGASLPPLFAVVPEDPMISAWTAERIRTLLFPSGEDAAMNVETRSGSELSTGEIVALLKERPLFGGRRLIWVEQGDRIPGLEDKKSLAHFIPTLPASRSVTMVFAIGDRKEDAFAPSMPVFRLGLTRQPQAREKEVREWIRLLAARKSLEMTAEALEILGREFEDRFGHLSSFLDQIPGTDEGSKVTVDRKTLEGLGVSDPFKSVFEIFQSWERKDKRAFEQWERFVEKGQTPLGLLALWHRQWRLYAMARLVSKKPGGEGELASRAKVPPFAARQALTIAPKLSAQTIRSGYALLRETDLMLKSGTDPSVAMDRFFVGMWDLSPSKGPVTRDARDVRTGR